MAVICTMSIPNSSPELAVDGNVRTEWQGMVYFPTGETAEWGLLNVNLGLSLFGPCRAHNYPRRRKKPDLAIYCAVQTARWHPMAV